MANYVLLEKQCKIQKTTLLKAKVFQFTDCSFGIHKYIHLTYTCLNCAVNKNIKEGRSERRKKVKQKQEFKKLFFHDLWNFCLFFIIQHWALSRKINWWKWNILHLTERSFFKDIDHVWALTLLWIWCQSLPPHFFYFKRGFEMGFGKKPGSKIYCYLIGLSRSTIEVTKSERSCGLN